MCSRQVRFLPFIGVITLALAGSARAAVSVTGASGGSAISADTAAVGGTGSWTSLGGITIAEGTNTDLGLGPNLTLVLRVPTGFEYNTNSPPSISFVSGRDITAASVVVTDSSRLTVTVTVAATTNQDTLVIGATGLQVRPTLAGPLPAPRHIYRPTTGGGTLTANGITSSTDGSTGSNFGNLTEVAGAFVKLLLLMPGETAAPGTPSGKSGTPSARTAGTSFNVIVQGTDTNWNVVQTASGANFTIQITSSDANAVLPNAADLASGTRTFSVTFRTANASSVTATDLDDPTKTGYTSPLVTVNPGVFNKLQALLPGESPAPGSTTGKTGSPAAQTAGVSFIATVRSVDANWNPINTNDVVHITSSDTNATLPADAPLTNGSRAFTILPRTSGSRTVTATNVTHPGITASTSSAFSVNPSGYAQLQVLMPGQTAAAGTPSGKTGTPSARTAGTSFNTLTVRAVDSYWNLVESNVTVAITSSDPHAVLPANAALGTDGTKSDFVFTFRTAGMHSISARDVNDASKTNMGSLTTVNPGAFAKLQLLMPGETPIPGSVTGKSGSALPQQSGQGFNITVRGVDAQWNVVNTNDTVQLTASDSLAVLPADAPLIAGTRDLNVIMTTPATNATLTSSNLTHPGILAGTSTVFTVKASIRGGPVVAIHDSELTRNLELLNASPPTPAGPGTTGKEWWTTNWHYFVMPEALKEALRSDGTLYEVVSDADILAGQLLDTNGRPKYPIVISLASEAIAQAEIERLTNYVAAGGFLLAGSSSFTRNTNGVSRGDFAFANELGIHMTVPGLTNWRASGFFNKTLEHRLVSHIPNGSLFWEMPASADEISWGTYPHPANPVPQALMWQVQLSDATLIAESAGYPYLAEKQFGKGRFIFHAAMQPLIAHGGWGCGMHAYVIFRKAIEWAFESARAPLPRLSPWPYPYDVGFMVRHDLENYAAEIANLEVSAQMEFTNGVKGDYFFCTGTLRVDMAGTYNTNAIVASLQRAVSNYHATIGPHNGGLRNPFNTPPLTNVDFDFWHWGPDDALDVTPAGYPDGKTYALTSVSNSFVDIEGWLPGLMTNGMRVWASPYFNSTREGSYHILAQLGVKIAGEQKLTPFPHWTLSTQTPGKRYSFLTLPVSDWFVGNTVAQSMEAGHNTNSVHALVDFYYSLGALINLYSHTLSTGLGTAGGLAPEYLLYGLNTNLHPRVWPTDSISLYNWWVQRSNAQVTAAYFVTNGNQALLTFSIGGSSDTNTTVELLLPVGWSNLQVSTNTVSAGANAFRISNQILKLRVGTAVTNAAISYGLGPLARDDSFNFSSGPVLSVSPPGVLINDSPGASNGVLTAILVTGPTNGILTFNTNGSFGYVPNPAFSETDSFTYKISDGIEESGVARVTLANTNPVSFTDNFTRSLDPAPIAPWVLRAGNWTVTAGELRAGTNTTLSYANVYLTNSWSDFAVQARLSFPSGAFGGALGGRLNPLSGAHYAAWVYPEGSAGGSNVLRLIRFMNWTTWTPIAEASLAAVGTNFHTIKLALHQNRIAVYFDNNLVISASDLPILQSGGISLDMWTDLSGYVAAFDDVSVMPLVTNDSYEVNQNSILSVNAPGILGNDTGVYGNGLNALLISGTAHGSLSLNTNGGFGYTPALNFYGPDSFIYEATDGPANLGSAWVNITVVSANPVIQSITLSNGIATLSWSSIVGRTYRLQFKNALADPNWNDVAPDIVAPGSNVTATNIVGVAQQRFYRIILLP